MTVGTIPEGVDPKFGLCFAIAAKKDSKKGFTKGNYVTYKKNGWLCQITETRDDEVHLVAIGWVKKEDCEL